MTWTRITVLAAIAALTSPFAACEGPRPVQKADGPAAVDSSERQAAERRAAATTVLAESVVGAQPERLRDLPLYEVTARVDYESATVSGAVRLRVRNTSGANWDELVLRAPGTVALAVPKTAPAGAPGAATPQAPTDVRVTVRDVQLGAARAQAVPLGAIVSVPLRPALEPGGEADLRFGFSTQLPVVRRGNTELGGRLWEQLQELVGLTVTQPAGLGSLSLCDGVVSLARFHPTLARRGPEGWVRQEPPPLGDAASGPLANYVVSLDVPDGALVAATGVRRGEPLPRREGQWRWTFAAGAVRDFAAVYAPKYWAVERRVGDVLLRSVYEGDHRPTGDRVLDVARRALAFFQERYGPLPLREVTVAEAPLLGGAASLSFPGLVTLGRLLYTTDAPAPAEPGGANIAVKVEGNPFLDEVSDYVIAHALAQQWWGSAVGIDRVEAPFLAEALAAEAALAFLQAERGAESAARQAYLHLELPYHVWRLLGGPDAPAAGSARDFAEPLAYHALAAAKGGLWLQRALAADSKEKAVGANPLAGLYAARRFGELRPADLQALLPSAAAGGAADAARWLRGRHGDEDIGAFDGQRFGVAIGLGETASTALAAQLGALRPEDVRDLADVLRALLGDDDDGAGRPVVAKAFRLIRKLAGVGERPIDPAFDAALRLFEAAGDPTPAAAAAATRGVLEAMDVDGDKAALAGFGVGLLLHALSDEAPNEAADAEAPEPATPPVTPAPDVTP